MVIPKDVTWDDLFALQARILKGDDKAKKEMAALYAKVFPHKAEIKEFHKFDLTLMYSHLDQALRRGKANNWRF